MTSALVLTLLQCSGSDTAGGVQTKKAIERLLHARTMECVCAAAASRDLVGAMSVQAILTPLDVHTAMCATETCRRSWRVEMQWRGARAVVTSSLAVVAAIVRKYAY